MCSLNDNVLIQDAQIDYKKNWIKKHIDSVRFSYCKAPYFKTYADKFFNILSKRFDTISELNVSIITWIMSELDIKTKIKMSSEFNASVSTEMDSTKTDRLIYILKKAGATSYLSGPSAMDYLEVEKFRKAGIALECKIYEYIDYPQLYGIFEANVSVLDLLFNCGNDAKKYLKSTSNQLII